jgi:putative ABC transport system permease protein
MLARVIQSQLYNVSPADPLTLGAVVLVLAVRALLASSIPARRAASTHPGLALRE